MNPAKSIIFLKDRSGVFKLRDDLQSFGFDERRGQYFVLFNNAERRLYYNPANVDVAEFTKELEPPFRVIRTNDGEVFHKVLGVRCYEGREHKAYRILFESGEGKNYPADYLSIEEHIDDQRSIDVWQYLNEVAKYNVIPTDDDKTLSLADKYERMAFVAKNSLLESYLNTETYSRTNEKRSAGEPIFPFGCNRSQNKAVKNALENKISIIQGPPGTGKTQTILNILANLLLEGKTVQIVSNNNSAVENVQEKLIADGLDFLCAKLGRVSNKNEFIEAQQGCYPDMAAWEISDDTAARFEARRLSKELQALYKVQEDLATTSEELKECKRQIEQFPRTVESKGRWSPQTLQKYLRICIKDMERKHHLSWLTRIRLRFRRLPADESSVETIQCHLFAAKIEKLEEQCAEYRGMLEGIEQKNLRLRELSLKILKRNLFKTYGSKKERKVFALDEIYLKSRDFLKEYPIVLSTTFSATSNINQEYKFDYLIMDEASQVDIASGALALSCANNVVVVGDLKQLPNVVSSHSEEVSDAVFAKYGLAEAYRYSKNSFLSSVCRLVPTAPQTLLKEHYRCDPLIIGFCSKQFYDGELIPMKKTEEEYDPVRVIRTVSGNHARGNVNFRQVDAVVQEVLPVLEERFTDIGIIAPYNKQVDAIEAALTEEGKNYQTATVHKFQGRENDAIILSTVDNQVREFTDDPHLLNVAVSRAKKQFTLIVSAGEQPDSNIQTLIDYIEYYQSEPSQSQVSSIFDLLYEGYSEELLDFYKTHRKVAEFDSENLAYWAINETIQEKGGSHLNVLMHYPLRYLITPSSNLTDEQRTYANRFGTHIDFLVYDTVTHKAKLAIEVDGTQYHREGSKQSARDHLKDSILQTLGLPELRLRTDGSSEKEKISKALFADR